MSDSKRSTTLRIFGKLEMIPDNKEDLGRATLCSNSAAMRLNASKRVATSFGVAYVT